ncbi:MAG: hypothetical protein WCG27_08370, partial [Pseudomonadota bacterium]
MNLKLFLILPLLGLMAIGQQLDLLAATDNPQANIKEYCTDHLCQYMVQKGDGQYIVDYIKN